MLSTGGANTDTTELYYRLTRPDWHPTRYLVPLANRALELAWQWWRSVVSPMDDADMEASGVTSWTASNATVTKATATGQVWAGARSLSVSATSANGYAQSTTFDAAPNRGFRFSAKVRQAAGAGAIFQVWDASNTTSIVQSATVLQTSWTDVMVTGTFPATCYFAYVRLVTSTSGVATLWDDVTGYWNLLTRVPLPSWVTQYRTEEGEQALRIYQQRNRLGSYDNWSARSYDLALVPERDYQIDAEPSAVNPLSIELARGETTYNWPLIVEARRPFADMGSVSADTDTSSIPLRLWVAAMKYLASMERKIVDRQEAWKHDYNREQWRVQSKLETPAPDSRGMRYQVLGA